MPLPGNAFVPGLSYYVGDPASAAVSAFDVPPGTLVIDPTNNLLRRKTAVKGTNTAGYVTMVGDTDTQTLTNKTLTNPVINGASSVGTVTTISGDGAIAIVSAVNYLTKGSAAAITIAAPGAAGIGVTLRITTGTDFAHVVTFTGTTLYDGTTGANSTWTAAAFAGSSITITGVTATKWNVDSFNLGTIAP